MKAVLMAAAAALTVGIAHAQPAGDVVTLELRSEPSGAKIYRTQPAPGFIGYAPHTINIPRAMFTERMGADGCVVTAAFKIQWVSGAIEEVPNVRMCLGVDAKYHTTFVRPAGAAGYAEDLRFEQLKKEEHARHQAPVLRSAPVAVATQEPPSSGISFGQALGAILGGMAEGYANRPPPTAYEPRRQIQCVSRNEFGSIRTVCE